MAVSFCDCKHSYDLTGCPHSPADSSSLQRPLAPPVRTNNQAYIQHTHIHTHTARLQRRQVNALLHSIKHLLFTFTHARPAPIGTLKLTSLSPKRQSDMSCFPSIPKCSLLPIDSQPFSPPLGLATKYILSWLASPPLLSSPLLSSPLLSHHACSLFSLFSFFFSLFSFLYLNRRHCLLAAFSLTKLHAASAAACDLNKFCASAGRSAGRLVGWTAGRLAGWPVGGLAGWRLGRPVVSATASSLAVRREVGRWRGSTVK
ncbi:unnamed protein product [Protopolystoma xenopodis]|uniref:Uncharacterized protein n=1 Tax=Protopolystoma xenopodis TaxID=117903 RepID=A0A3S5CNH8_9PLAT|nr:unnamed protein product [Protopolystoma xenopodis]